MSIRPFVITFALLVCSGALSASVALAAPVSSSVFQVKSACLRTLSESEVARLSASDLRLYVTICSRIPTVLASLVDPPSPPPAVVPPTPTLAAQRAALESKMTELRLDVALTTVALVQTDAKDAALQQAADDKAAADSSDASKKACRDLSTTESALTGGLALNPAAYGKTYIGVAALIAPFFFPHCDTPSPTTAQKVAPDPSKQQLQTQADSLMQQLSALTTQYNAL